MEKAKVEVISTCMIKATGIIRVDESKIQLTPFDLEYLSLDYMQIGLLFNKPTPAQEVKLVLSRNTHFIDQLKESLSKTLSFFPPYAGRLMTNIIDNGAGCNFSLDCNNGGALFMHAIANNLSVADIVIPNNPSSNIVHAFFPLNGARSYEGISQPLLAIQVTELIDGLFIGCTFNHVAGDGTSFWRFINSWAKISRVGVHALPTHPFPVLKRGFPFDFQSPINIGCNEKLIAASRRKRFHAPLLELEERVFHFSKESIAKLKEKANLEMNTDKISCLQALVAHLWISIVYSRSIGANQETTFEIPIEFRNKLNPPLPDGYFGNAIFPGLVTLSVREISNRGLGWTALQINRMIASCGHEQINKACMSWVKKPTFLKIENLPNNFFILVNSPRFDVYGNDFGWGKPIAARTGKGIRFDGRVTIYAGAEQGSVDVEVCLSRRAMAKM